MVFTSIALCGSRKIANRIAKRKFIDSLRLYVRGGGGGSGLPRLGGVGGKGGDVYVQGTDGISLKNIVNKFPTKRILAKCGENSHSRNIVGVPGADVVFEAPVGITVFDEFGRILGELNHEGERVLVARGGAGGNPATLFTGLRGQAHSIILDLKLIADVGLVGFPNAGKSSLLKALSRAKPKIASYPFTTIEPELGILQYKDNRRITMADLPGLIEGAHANIGLGHKFLKHLDRTQMLLMMVDVQGFRLGPRYPHRSALETVVLLNKEMELYQPDLLKKPMLLAINKMDTPGAEDKLKEMKDKLKNLKDAIEEFPEEFRPTEVVEFFDILTISVTSSRKSTLELKDRIRHVLEVHAEMERENIELELRNELQWKLTETGTIPV